MSCKFDGDAMVVGYHVQLVLWMLITASAIERESSSHLELLNLLHNFHIITLDTVIGEHIVQLLAQPVGVGLRYLLMRATVERLNLLGHEDLQDFDYLSWCVLTWVLVAEGPTSDFNHWHSLWIFLSPYGDRFH